MPEDQKAIALNEIREELDEAVLKLRSDGRLLEAQRLMGRTRYDLEMIKEVGYCSGIENYARFFDGRARGTRAFCLLDYFRSIPDRKEDDWLVLIDESHVTIPQIKGMYHGDRARKQTLVDHGFRLPSALDNRPLKLDEFEELSPQIVYVSATPANYELEKSEGVVVEQVIRPTGLVDPPVEVRSARGQVPDLVVESRKRAAAGERTLVTALTKRLCEELANYLQQEGIRVRYLHSEIDTLDRLEILADLRSGDFDVLVGVNLLREGLDLPEVSLVCILDADKQGFLRSTSSLIQTMGRAARNANSTAILYADKITPEMQAAMDEVARRRERQLAYNKTHGITPQTIQKAIRRGLEQELAGHRTARDAVGKRDESSFDRDEVVREIEAEMLRVAEERQFERAAELRDQLFDLQNPDEAGSQKRKPPGKKAGEPGSRAGRTGRKSTRKSG
jgi:excinuclease ABC subunit B